MQACCAPLVEGACCASELCSGSDRGSCLYPQCSSEANSCIESISKGDKSKYGQKQTDLCAQGTHEGGILPSFETPLQILRKEISCHSAFCLTGALTAVFVCPLDVLKTRLQVQQRNTSVKYLGLAGWHFPPCEHACMSHMQEGAHYLFGDSMHARHAEGCTMSLGFLKHSLMVTSAHMKRFTFWQVSTLLIPCGNPCSRHAEGCTLSVSCSKHSLIGHFVHISILSLCHPCAR